LRIDSVSINEHHITRTFTFPDFKQALAFAVPVGQAAPPMALDEVRKCAHEGHVDYDIFSGRRASEQVGWRLLRIGSIRSTF